MRVSVRTLALAASLFLLADAAHANQVYLPQAPNGPGGEDSIETGSGTRCRQSINSNGAYLDMGAVGNAASQVQGDPRLFFNLQPEREGMAYARVTIPLGRRPKRIDCTSIYELELARLRQEIELLRMNAD